MAAVRWISLAEVARAHGVWGEVRLKVYNGDSELLLSQPEVLVRRASKTVDGPTSMPSESMMQLESIRGAEAGFLLAKFKGVDGRDAADLLRGAAICVDRSRFPPALAGEFYVCDVIGARLLGPEGAIGIVEDYVNYPTTDVLVVRLDAAPKEKGRVELPLIEDFIQWVDAGVGQVRLTTAGVDWLEGVEAGKARHAD